MIESEHQPENRTADIVVEVFGCTDVGRTREHNEDAFMVAELGSNARPDFSAVTVARPQETAGMVFMVADGMGGAAAGEIASRMAVESVLNELQERHGNRGWAGPRDFARALRDATTAANTQIYRFASENTEHRGMGTTATIVGLHGDTLFISQIGDSRAYLLREGRIRQLTRDQSLMQRLVDAGEITAEEAARSERRNIILQALGPEPQIRSDISSQPLRRGDLLLLCSDGLSGQISDADILAAFAEGSDLAGVCRALVALANDRGGPDNITVVAARFTGRGLDLPEADDPMGYAMFMTSGESEAVTPEQDRSVEEEPESARAPASPPAPLWARAPREQRFTDSESFNHGVTYAVLLLSLLGVAVILFRRFL